MTGPLSAKGTGVTQSLP